MRNKIVLGGVALLFAVGLLAGSAKETQATMDMQKKAKAAGYEATNCLYCHGEKLPKKEAFTNNHRGQWLKDEKEKKKAKEIDVTWLKDYVEPKK